MHLVYDERKQKWHFLQFITRMNSILVDFIQLPEESISQTQESLGEKKLSSNKCFIARSQTH